MMDLSPSTAPSAPAIEGTRSARWLQRLGTVLSWITLAATLGTLLARYHWLCDILANLRVQQVIGIAVLLGWMLFTRRWRLATALAVCCVIHLPWFQGWFASRMPLAEAPSSTAGITVTTANVLIDNPTPRLLDAAIFQPQADVLAIVELGTSLQETLADELASAYPHRHELPRDEDGFGIGLYAKQPLDDVQVIDLGEIFRAITARVLVRGQAYRILAAHTVPPVGSELAALRNDQLGKLANVVRELTTQEPACPIILMGDLNTTPWSPFFREFARDSGLSRATRGAYLTPTWHCLPAFPFGLTLDHVMISDELQCVGITVGEPMGSDHRTVTAELRHTPRK